MAVKKAAATAKARTVRTAPKPRTAARKRSTTSREARPKMIKVMATQMGYYDHVRRRPGDVFLIPERMYSKKWMEMVDRRVAERITTVEESLRKQHDDILALKYGDKAPGTESDPIGADED